MEKEESIIQTRISTLTIVLTILIIFISSLSSVVAAPQRDPVGSVAPPPDISIITDRDVYEVSTEPGTSDGSITIIGSVLCEMPESIPPGTQCLVQIILNIQMNDGNLLPQMTFTNEITKLDFTYDLEISTGETAGTNILVSIYGNWQYDGGLGYGDINPSPVTVKILQYGSVEMENNYLNTYWEMEIGKTEEFEIKVSNLGNGADTITISVIDLPDGFEIEFEANSVLLKANGFRKIIVRIKQVDGGAQTGIFMFQCSSSVQGIQSTDQLDVTYKTTEPTHLLSAGEIITISVLSLLLMASLIGTFLTLRFRKISKSDGQDSRASLSRPKS